MASGLCPACGDASGEAHVCRPVPGLPQAPAPAYWGPGPEVTQRIAALEAENAHLRAVLARYADVLGEDALVPAPLPQ